MGVKVGNGQPWIVSEPASQADGVQRLQQQQQRRRKDEWKDEEEDEEKEEEETAGEDVGRGLKAVRSMPVRSLADGEFVLEVWVEEGKGKFGEGQEGEPRLP